MSTKRNFNDLARPILADPARAAQVKAHREQATAEHIAFSLNTLRESLGISQDEIATRLGVTQSAVSQGLRSPSRIDMLRRYVQALGGELEIAVKIAGERTLIDV